MAEFVEAFIPQAWLCWIFPMVGALLTPLLSKINPKVRDYGAVFFSLLAALMAASMIPLLFDPHPRIYYHQVEWIKLPGSPILSELKAGVIVDSLSIIMANVVAIISFLIMVYSLGYMHGDPSLTRYWFFMNFFIGNMLLLVMSDNIIQMLFGWEGVGLCSYALIGFRYQDSKEDWLTFWVGEPPEAYPPSHCGMKAFITTRVGDVCMFIGAFIILALTGTLSFKELMETVQGHYFHELVTAHPEVLKYLVIAAAFLFGGPVGKSAQLPLMEWLPDAMAGPTTVSALIHAATMVKAGVYLVGRVFPIFYAAAWLGGHVNELVTFFYLVGWIGVLTAFIAGTQAMASSEIKKVWAYSTVSQIGYMMMGLGVAGATTEFAIGYTGGIFHLMSHAMFKAALFLTAGSVIHATESRFFRHYGGLKKHMPITYWCMALAAFSLMGVPVFFSGFWSKDLVLEASLMASISTWPLFVLGVLSVAVTCFYTVRALGLTFFGSESRHIHELELEGRHIHEAPKVMWVPYAALAAATVVFGVGGFFVASWLEKLFHHHLEAWGLGVHVLHVAKEAPKAGYVIPHETAVLITILCSLSMLLAGAIPAYFIYVKRRTPPEKLLEARASLRALWRFLFRRWYVNAFYYKAFVHSVISAANWLFKYLESAVIDKFNYVLAQLSQSISSKFRRTHTGLLSYNMAWIAAGFVVFVLLIAFLLR
ncbi:MAG: NADH-quinone oxidoreductase subunit L [Candidatus Nezhaarchaeota archaeon]|nr:NADH-quinone oxidoreductase subunit L [Candidatus Nezhaarchaeota archaeon]